MSKPKPLTEAQGADFWRGLDDVIAQPGFGARLRAAFPDLAGASDWKRRDILKCLGGALALAGLDACERLPDGEALPYVVQPDGAGPGTIRHYASAVELEGIAQPIVGKTYDGRPIKLEGNARHPASGGATDAFTQAALLGLYDPDRSTTPRHRGQITDWTRYDEMIADLRGRLDASGGAGFRLLTGRVGSPTMLRQIAAMQARWPAMAWHGWSILPEPDERLHLERAHAIVAFDHDLLGPGPLQTWHALGWSARRRAYQAGEGQAQLYVAEPVPTLTGVASQDRLVIAADRMAALLVALAARLGFAGQSPPQLNSREQAWLDGAATALADNPGRGLVVVGEEYPASLRDLARAIDARLGNEGVRERLSAPGSAPRPLAALASDMRRGDVSDLLVIDVNPAYGAPPKLDFARVMARVPLTIHAGLHLDETAINASWHAPLAHALESWSDGTAADGSAVIMQPLVRPWLHIRSRHALLAGLLGDSRPDLAQVRATWTPQLNDDGWRQALLAGQFEVPPAPRSIPPAQAIPVEVPSLAFPDRLHLHIRPDPSIWDGRFSSNPWLQELPKPLSKLTWGNAIQISPALADQLDFATGDQARLTVGDRRIEGPILILPGHERRTILLHLGHGRRAGSRLAGGVGFDVVSLLGAPGEPRLEKIGGRETLATTQTHFAMEDEDYVRFVATAADKLPSPPPQPSFYGSQKSRPAWGMAIDLDLCIGCNACVVACVAENNIPMVGREQVAMGRAMHWLRIDRYEQGSADEHRHSFQPVPCMHCEDAPCEMGCPVNAAVHSPDGLNLQVYNRCIGTRTCSAYCPYKVRRFNWLDLTSQDPPELRAARNPDVTVRARGVMEKCTYCIQRISTARIDAKKEDRAIRDGEVVTACQAVCPTNAIIFGDIADRESAVSKRKTSGRDFTLLSDANTRPRTTYAARIERGRA